MKKTLLVTAGLVVVAATVAAVWIGLKPTGEKLFTANARDLQGTDVTPYFEREIAGSNVVYCSTFQIAWNEFKEKICKGDVHLVAEPSCVAYLNSSAASKDDLSDKDRIAAIGFGRDNIVGKINAELRQKFPHLEPISETLEPNDILAYAFLEKNLEFDHAFEEARDPLKFGGVGVAAFGLNGHGGEQFETLAEQVRILDYQNDDDFIVRLHPKDRREEIVLAKVKPESTLAKTCQRVVERAQAGKAEHPMPDDVLRIPKFKFDLTKTFDELVGKNLANAELTDYSIRVALQRILFKLDERGAVLKSEARFTEAPKSEEPKEPPRPKRLIFDKPFLLYMRESAAANPYFAAWIQNAELLCRR